MPHPCRVCSPTGLPSPNVTLSCLLAGVRWQLRHLSRRHSTSTTALGALIVANISKAAAQLQHQHGSTAFLCGLACRHRPQQQCAAHRPAAWRAGHACSSNSERRWTGWGGASASASAAAAITRHPSISDRQTVPLQSHSQEGQGIACQSGARLPNHDILGLFFTGLLAISLPCQQPQAPERGGSRAGGPCAVCSHAAPFLGWCGGAAGGAAGQGEDGGC
jgi:hypothetical protein